MSKTRKILSIVLAVVMAFSVFSICAFADTDTATWTVEVTNLDGTAIAGSIQTGDKVLVTVKLQTNFYVGTVGLPVLFSDAFEYVDASVNQVDIYGTGATRKAFNDDLTEGVPSGKNAVYAVYVANSGAAGVASPLYSTATTILSFQLEAVSEGTADVYLDASMQKTTSNMGGKFYCGSRATSDVTTTEAMVGQTFVVPAAAQVVIANVVATYDLVAKAGNTGVVDNANGYVYGVAKNTEATEAAFGAYFEVTDGGHFTISGNGTGAVLTVTETGATYTLIIFGDVNGDGTVSGTDLSAITRALAGAGLSGAQAVAADVNGSGSASAPDVSGTDLSVITRALAGAGFNTVNPWA